MYGCFSASVALRESVSTMIGYGFEKEKLIARSMAYSSQLNIKELSGKLAFIEKFELHTPQPDLLLDTEPSEYLDVTVVCGNHGFVLT